MYPLTLHGPRLRVREFHQDDLDGSMAIVGDPQITRLFTIATRTRGQQAEQLATEIARARSRPRPEYSLAAVERDTDELVGTVRLGLDQPPHGELGYAVRRDRWGRGYATEMARLMVDYAFGELGLHRIQGSCAPDNTASTRVLTRLGFTYDGRLRGITLTEEGWRDSLVYSLLEDEWEADVGGDTTAPQAAGGGGAAGRAT